MNTTEIQRMIDEKYSTGGGVVKIPAGIHSIFTIELKSNISLYLEEGCILKGGIGLENYNEIGFYHNELGEVKSMIYAKNANNVSISGKGIIDFNGMQYYDKNIKRVPEAIIGKISDRQFEECCLDHGERLNQPMIFLQCKNITLDGITLLNAPTWGTTFIESSEIKVSNIFIRYPLNIPNSDGLHFCSCSNVEIVGCDIISGDDCIAITSITNWSKKSQNFTIENCHLQTSSKAISIGYMHSHVENIFINNVVINDSNRGIVFMQNPYTGSIKNVIISNCQISTKIVVGDWWGNGEPICIMAKDHQLGNRGEFDYSNFDEGICNIHLKNISCIGENKIAILGEEENIKNVTIENVTFNAKLSDNINIKGQVVDLAPAEKNYDITMYNESDMIVDGCQNLIISGETKLKVTYAKNTII